MNMYVSIEHKVVVGYKWIVVVEYWHKDKVVGECEHKHNNGEIGCKKHS